MVPTGTRGLTDRLRSGEALTTGRSPCREGQADVALMHLPFDSTAGLDTEVLFTDRCRRYGAPGLGTPVDQF
jgi:hypothetical protein